MTVLIEVREHGRVSISDAIAEATPSEFWTAADCEVTKSVADDPWTLKAGNSVGVTRWLTPGGDVTLHVRPKLDSADIFFMADYAYEQRQEPLRLLDGAEVDLAVVLQDPTACLLVWHARAIRKFASRWLRRDYQSTTRVLKGKVKGKVLVGSYVSNHLAIGDAASIPCRLLERTQDTPNNRILKAGLRYIAATSHSLPVLGAQRAVLREVNAALPLFAHVSDIRVSHSDIRRTSTRGPARHYAAILRATIDLLENHLMSNEVAGSQVTSAFMWRMPVLFQEFVRGLLDSSPGLSLQRDRPGAVGIFDSTGKRRRLSKVDPDLVLRNSAGSTLLVDTKYKDVLPSGSQADDTDITLIADRHRIKVSPTDIYQVIAYRQHERWPGSTATLLYPLVLAPGDSLPYPLEVRGFGEPVFLLFIDVGLRARSNLEPFLDTLRRFLAEDTGALAG